MKYTKHDKEGIYELLRLLTPIRRLSDKDISYTYSGSVQMISKITGKKYQTIYNMIWKDRKSFRKNG